MGHSDIRTTYNLYGHMFPDREDELVENLDRRYGRALVAHGGAEPDLGVSAIGSALGSSPSGTIEGGSASGNAL